MTNYTDTLPAKATVIHIPLVEDTDVWNEQDRGHVFETERDVVILRGKAKHAGGRVCDFTLHYHDDQAAPTRREYKGPLVEGEYAYLVPQATVIAAHPLPRPTTVIEIKDGDFLLIQGRVFQLRDDRMLDYPQLVRL